MPAPPTTFCTGLPDAIPNMVPNKFIKIRHQPSAEYVSSKVLQSNPDIRITLVIAASMKDENEQDTMAAQKTASTHESGVVVCFPASRKTPPERIESPMNRIWKFVTALIH